MWSISFFNQKTLIRLQHEKLYVHHCYEEEIKVRILVSSISVIFYPKSSLETHLPEKRDRAVPLAMSVPSEPVSPRLVGHLSTTPVPAAAECFAGSCVSGQK